MKSVGQVLFNDVVQKLGLLEADYFDLEYTDVHRVHVSTTTTTRLRRVPEKNQAELFSSELRRQISTNFDNFWHKDGQDDKIRWCSLIFHLTYNLCQRITVLNADVPNCYITLQYSLSTMDDFTFWLHLSQVDLT